MRKSYSLSKEQLLASVVKPDVKELATLAKIVY